MDKPDYGSATLLTEPHNYAVVQLPGRKFPGIVFQGDSLYSLCEEVRTLSSQSDPGEVRADAARLSRDLDELLHSYVTAVSERGGSLPFSY